MEFLEDQETALNGYYGDEEEDMDKLKQSLKEKKLESPQAKNQLNIIMSENIHNPENVIRNLAKIEDLNHFLHSTYEILNRKPHSGLTFSRKLICINDSLWIAPITYNTVGNTPIQCKIAQLLRNEKNKKEIHSRLRQLYYAKDINYFFDSDQLDLESGLDSKCSQTFYEKLRFVLKTADQIRSKGIFENEKEMEHLVNILKLHEAVNGTELIPDSEERHLKIKILYDKIIELAPRRKEELIKATIVAREFSQTMKEFNQLFEQEKDTQTLSAVRSVRKRIYARALNNLTLKNASPTQYQKIKANKEADKVLRKLEKISANLYECANSFLCSHFERLSFTYHKEQVEQQLLDAFELDNMSKLEIPGKNGIFNKMNIVDYDRLRRVFDESTLDEIKDSAALCKDGLIARYIVSPDDFACVVELRKLNAARSRDELIQNITKIAEVPTLHSWRSILSKTYHYIKHSPEFQNGEVECSPMDYFNKHAADIFFPIYRYKPDLFTQSGDKRAVFYSVKRTFTHLGYASCDVEQVYSHYRKGISTMKLKTPPSVAPPSPAALKAVLTSNPAPARIPRQPAPQLDSNPRGWLLLKNQNTDCFLNAALQLLRRYSPIRIALEEWQKAFIDSRPDPVPYVDNALSHLAALLVPRHTGIQNVNKLRAALPLAVDDQMSLADQLNFKTSQQDASEVLQAILQFLPNNARTPMTTTTMRQLRCADQLVETCPWRRTPDDVAPFVIYHVAVDYEEVNLEAMLDPQWHDDNPAEDDEDGVVHCPKCCECCRDAIAYNEVHNDHSCVCLSDKSPFCRQVKTEFTGAGEYFCLMLNILHRNVDGTYSRKDWALAAKCDLKQMRMFGRNWRAVAIIKHIGHESTQWQKGHYFTYVLEDDGEWWKHEDRMKPTSIGRDYSLPSSHRYPEGCTDMEGVTVVLFEAVA